MIGNHHRVVHEVRFAGLEHGFDRVVHEIVGCERGVDAERDVGHDLAQRPLDAQNRPHHPAVGGAEVGVCERIGHHSVEADPEPSQFLVEVAVRDTDRERLEQPVKVAEVDGVGGH